MKSRWQNTSKSSLHLYWLSQQEAFIASLKRQPFVVVLRPTNIDFKLNYSRGSLFDLIEQLHSEGVKHIEVAWSSHPQWISLMKQIKETYKAITLGVASITSSASLESVAELNLSYAMTPIWNPALQNKAKQFKLLLIPGVFSPTEIQQAKSYGCKVIKLFPASTLGIKYIHQVKDPIGSLPFLIAAGGLTIDDLSPWLKEGYGAITLGRGLIQNHYIDPKLKEWLHTNKNIQ